MKLIYPALQQWLRQNHPQYSTWDVEMFMIDYEISMGWGEIIERLREKDYFSIGELEGMDSTDLEGVFDTVKAPEGFLYITLTDGVSRVGINVPNSIDINGVSPDGLADLAK